MVIIGDTKNKNITITLGKLFKDC